MKKLLIVLFTALLAAGFVACSNPSSENTIPTFPASPSTPPAPTYSVTIEPSTNGTVTASKTSGIAAGETITLTVTPAVTDDMDYKLGRLSVKNGDVDVTITNNSFTMPSGNVKVTATFDVIVYYGTKKPSKAKEVGDIVFNDGSAMPYADFEALSDEAKNAKKTAAIALIFYKGTGLNSDAADGTADTTTSRTLGVGLKHYKIGLAWCLSSADACNKDITTIRCLSYANVIPNSWYFTGDKNGSDNLEQIEAFEGVDDTGTSANYPAFYFAKNYSITATNLGTDYASGWYLPSIAELFQIYACRADSTNGFDIDAASAALGGSQFGESLYWSSTQNKIMSNIAYMCQFIYNINTNVSGWGSGIILNCKSYGDYGNCVCAIRAFN